MQHSKDEILALFDKWNEALKSGNPDNMLPLYSETALLLPTVSNKIRHNHEEIRDYFVSFMQRKPSGVLNETNPRILGNTNIAMNSGIYTFTLTQPTGETVEVQARYTYIYEYKNNEWKIIEHHSSLMPE